MITMGDSRLKRSIVTLAAFPATFCCVSCKRSFNSLIGFPLNASRTSPAEKPALAASLVSGTSSRMTPVSPGLPSAETSPRPTMLRTFAPAQTATSRLRVDLRVGGWHCRLMEQVEIDILRPLPHLNRFVGRKDDIAAENIMAVVVPDMRMK